MGDGTEFDDALLGLPGFRVMAVSEDGDELLVGIETIRQAAGCPSCGVIARTKDRLPGSPIPVIPCPTSSAWSRTRASTSGQNVKGYSPSAEGSGNISISPMSGSRPNVATRAKAPGAWRGGIAFQASALTPPFALRAGVISPEPRCADARAENEERSFDLVRSTAAVIRPATGDLEVLAVLVSFRTNVPDVGERPQ